MEQAYDIVNKLVDMINKTAPELWRIAQRQVMVSLVLHIFTLLAFALFIAITIRYVVNRYKKCKAAFVEDSWSGKYSVESFITHDLNPGGWTMVCISIVLFIPVIMIINSIIGYALNPEYHAIRELITLGKWMLAR